MSKNVGEDFRPPATSLPAWLPTRKRNHLDLGVYREPGAFFVIITADGRQAWFREPAVAEHCIGALQTACESEGFNFVAYCSCRTMFT